MQEVQLYIQGEKVELFKDETISINDTIQNVRDVKKVFTTFSKQFNLPASRNNNKIFKHYYNYDIVNGFDARFKVDALIKLNGTDWRKGKLRLNSVSLKDNVAYSYKVVFFGETVNLTDILKDDDISDLDLSDYDHSYDINTVYNGLKTGLTIGGATSVLRDVVYPLTSNTYRYIYDSSGVGTALDNTTNLYTNDITSSNAYGIEYTQLTPAIKLKHIITAITAKYPELVFSSDFFSTDDFTELYLLLQREKGGIYAGVDELSKLITLNDWVYSSGDNNITNPLVAEWQSLNYNTTWELEFTVTTVDTGDYDVTVKDKITGDILSVVSGLNGTQTVAFNMISTPVNTLITYEVEFIVSTTDPSNFTTFTPSLKSIYKIQDELTLTTTTGNYVTSPASQTIISEIIISQQIPKMKVIDFITSIWQMFNLTAYVDDGVIVTKTLDDYYSDGNTHDITKYVDVKESTISKALLFSQIEYKFAEPKTFAIITRNERFNDEFGNLDYNGGEKFDGGSYNVDLKFGKMLYERLIDVNTETQTDIMYGWLADDKQDPTLTNPLVFYNDNRDSSADELGFIDKGTISTYNSANNVKEDETQTINFNAELDEWTGSTNTESLFNNFHINYISNLFNIKTRIYKLTAYLPLSIILNYKLNDVFVVSGKQYNINNIDIDLELGKSKIELINKYEIL